MTATIIDGKKLAQGIESSLRGEIETISRPKNKEVKLVTVRMGENHSTGAYMRIQRQVAERLGIHYEAIELSAETSRERMAGLIGQLNADRSVTAILMHAPFPRHIDAHFLRELIAPEKDAEGLHPINLGRLFLGNLSIAPCTPLACMHILEATGVKLRGKEAVIVGHSEITGKPLALLLLSKMVTTSICHIATSESGHLENHVRSADILVVSVGKSGLIPGSWVKRGAIVIDVGINHENGLLTGDVDFEGAQKRASRITPVPGGVGPVTVAMLMKNVVKLAKRAAEK